MKKGDRVEGDVTLLLKDYADIFSSFDPRPYDQRALSVDFLEEAKRATRDKNQQLSLSLLVPSKKRSVAQEKVIRDRLKQHFRKHATELVATQNHTRTEGVWFVLAGVFLMFIATFILFQQSEKQFLFSFLLILLEPAGWFLFWEGLSQAIFEPRKKQQDLLFYQKMMRCNVLFLSYTQ